MNGTSRDLLIRTIRSRSITANDRLDAGFFTDLAMDASERIALLEASGLVVQPMGSFAKVWMPPRTALARAAREEESVPYLRPYDVFDYLPKESDRISRSRNQMVEQFTLSSGLILQTRSGRNLGPCTLVDSALSDFALSDDMIRIQVDDDRQRLLLLLFLKTALGQALLRRGRSGSVIDHLTVADVAAVPVPMIENREVDRLYGLIREAIVIREQSRLLLASALGSLVNELPPLA